MESLTIIIPTYNRLKELENTVKRLVPQITNEKIIIIDNNSDHNLLESDILELLKDINHEIIVNNVNVGLSGNFLKAFETCKTEYLWILSDDDHPCENAIELIENSISVHKGVSFIKFSSTIYKEEGIKLLRGEDDFLNYFSFNPQFKFSNLIFISNTIFNSTHIRDYIREGYHFSNTHAPHIAIIFNTMIKGKGMKMLIHDQYLVDQVVNPENRWTLYKVYLGFTSFDFLNLNIDKLHYKKLLKIVQSTRKYYRSVFVELYKLGVQSNNLYLSKKIFGNIFFGVRRSLFDTFVIRMLYFILDKPFLFNIILKLYPKLGQVYNSFDIQKTDQRL